MLFNQEVGDSAVNFLKLWCKQCLSLFALSNVYRIFRITNRRRFMVLFMFLLPFFSLLFTLIVLAGDNASFNDASYIEVGAIILSDAEQVIQDADIITKIRPPNDDEIPKLQGKTLISTIQPAINKELYETLTEQGTNVFALDCVPRMLSRGQSYDTLSSQANIAGYRAVIEAAEQFPRFFAGQMTAAGKVPPAKVLVLGAG